MTEEEVEQIKEVTLRDVAAGVCGTEAETLIYFMCDKCKGKEEVEANKERALAEAAKVRRGRDKRSRYRRSRYRRESV